MSRLLAAVTVTTLVVMLSSAPSVRADPPIVWRGMTADQVFFKVRDVFRSHRPPPTYETYTLDRRNNDAEGYPDYSSSYTFHIWVRTTDKAALAREISRLGAIGQLEFMRPQFNAVDAPEDHPEIADPGPPTADLFEPAPIHPRPITFVPTPEPNYTPLPVIAHQQLTFNLDYWVNQVDVEDGLLHLSLSPRRDPERNRLRELYADPHTYELRRVVATDRLQVCYGGRHSCEIFPTLFTITVAHLQGIPVVTHIHGVVGGGYNGDDQIVEYSFTNIAFPKSLPDWYFNPTQYAQHQQDAPS